MSEIRLMLKEIRRGLKGNGEEGASSEQDPNQLILQFKERKGPRDFLYLKSSYKCVLTIQMYSKGAGRHPKLAS